MLAEALGEAEAKIARGVGGAYDNYVSERYESLHDRDGQADG